MKDYDNFEDFYSILPVETEKAKWLREWPERRKKILGIVDSEDETIAKRIY